MQVAGLHESGGRLEEEGIELGEEQRKVSRKNGYSRRLVSDNCLLDPPPVGYCLTLFP
jgi:hypothetical protein